MIKPLSYQTLITMGHMCGLCNPVYVMDIRSGKIYAGAYLDVDPVSEHVLHTPKTAHFGHSSTAKLGGLIPMQKEISQLGISNKG